MHIDHLKKKIYNGDNIVNLAELRYLPRWVILFIDIILLFCSVFFSYNILNQLGVNTKTYITPEQKYVLIVSVNIVYMFLLKTFAGIIRHSTFIDLFKIVLASLFTVVTVSLINLISIIFFQVRLFRYPVLVIYFLTSFATLFMFRLLVKEFFQLIKEYRRSTSKKRILVL